MPLTYTFIGISLFITLITWFGEIGFILLPLLISEYYTGISEIMSGQIWRLVTPIFIHFHIFHIVFNMLWLWDLGGTVERIQGSRILLMLVLISGILSNVGQHLFTGPLFGGMSGVVYALLGYVWMQGLFNPRFYASLNKAIVVMMLVWFVICWIGIIGNVANIAHTVGLVVGVVWGYLYAKNVAIRSRRDWL